MLKVWFLEHNNLMQSPVKMFWRTKQSQNTTYSFVIFQIFVHISILHQWEDQAWCVFNERYAQCVQNIGMIQLFHQHCLLQKITHFVLIFSPQFWKCEQIALILQLWQMRFHHRFHLFCGTDYFHSHHDGMRKFFCKTTQLRNQLWWNDQRSVQNYHSFSWQQSLTKPFYFYISAPLVALTKQPQSVLQTHKITISGANRASAKTCIATALSYLFPKNVPHRCWKIKPTYPWQLQPDEDSTFSQAETENCPQVLLCHVSAPHHFLCSKSFSWKTALLLTLLVFLGQSEQNISHWCFTNINSSLLLLLFLRETPFLFHLRKTHSWGSHLIKQIDNGRKTANITQNKDVKMVNIFVLCPATNQGFLHIAPIFFRVFLCSLQVLVSWWLTNLFRNSPGVSLQSSQAGHPIKFWSVTPIVSEWHSFPHESGQEQTHILHPVLLFFTWNFLPEHCVLHLCTGHRHLQMEQRLLSFALGIMSFPCWKHCFLHAVPLKVKQSQLHQNWEWQFWTLARALLGSLAQFCLHKACIVFLDCLSAKEKCVVISFKWYVGYNTDSNKQNNETPQDI